MSALPPRKRTLGLASLPALAELKALTASERASVIDAIAASALRGPAELARQTKHSSANYSAR